MVRAIILVAFVACILAATAGSQDAGSTVTVRTIKDDTQTEGVSRVTVRTVSQATKDDGTRVIDELLVSGRILYTLHKKVHKVHRKVHRIIRRKVGHLHRLKAALFLKKYRLFYPIGYGRLLGFGFPRYSRGIFFGKKYGYGYGNFPYTYSKVTYRYVSRYFTINRWYMRRVSHICFRYGCPTYYPFGRRYRSITGIYSGKSYPGRSSHLMKAVNRMYMWKLMSLRRSFFFRFHRTAPFYNFRPVPGPYQSFPMFTPPRTMIKPVTPIRRIPVIRAPKRPVIKRPVVKRLAKKFFPGHVVVWINGKPVRKLYDGQRGWFNIKFGKRITFQAVPSIKRAKRVVFRIGNLKPWVEGTAPYVYQGNIKYKFNYWRHPIVNKWITLYVDVQRYNGTWYRIRVYMYLKGGPVRSLPRPKKVIVRRVVVKKVYKKY